MQFSPIGHTVIKLPSVDSTNNYAATLLNETNVLNGTVILAKNQTNGKGQMGNSWNVNPSENLTFTIVLKDVKLEIERQFILSMWVAISTTQFLKDVYSVENKIKWPNDILVGKHKICGTLIENSIRGKSIPHSIIGIGLNVNQQIFPEGINATSLANERKEVLLVEAVLENLLKYLNKNYTLLISQDDKTLFEKYYANLLGFNEYLNYSANGEVFETKIIGVKPSGLIQLENKKEVIREYNFKELKLIL